MSTKSLTNLTLIPEPGEPLPPDRLVDEAVVDRITTVAKALSDPVRVRMIAAMARGRNCCILPDLGVPVPDDGPAAEAICVCEFQELSGLAQSKVSYHLRILKDAGLVFEERRGRWSFYGLLPDALTGVGAALQALTPNIPCC